MLTGISIIFLLQNLIPASCLSWSNT